MPAPDDRRPPTTGHQPPGGAPDPRLSVIADCAAGIRRELDRIDAMLEAMAAGL